MPWTDQSLLQRVCSLKNLLLGKLVCFRIHLKSTSAPIAAGGILQTPKTLTTRKTRQPVLHLGTGEAKK